MRYCDPTPSSARLGRTLLAAVLLALLAACSSGDGGTAVIEIEGPDLEPRRIAIRTLEPGPTPTPTPTPTPVPEETPTPVPQPTPTPVPAPGGAGLRAASGTQEGAPSSFCWSGSPGSSSECFDFPPPEQHEALPVALGEVVLLAIRAVNPPDEASIRPFQGTRAGYPAQPLSPALETELVIELDPGDWSLDFCATWRGHGQPICWLFRVAV